MARTLLLDLDGTLVDTVPDLKAALNRLMAARGLAPFGPAETAAMIGDGVAVLVTRAFAARGLTPDDRAIPEFSLDYGAHAAVASRAYPGVLDFLRDMEAEGWRMAVCTNKPEAAARTLLAATGVLPMLAAVGGGDSFPVRKPDPAHLLATLRAAGGDVTRAIMIGDHANDVAAAKGAGVPSVFVTWGYGPRAMAAGASALAANPGELAAQVRRLLPVNA